MSIYVLLDEWQYIFIEEVLHRIERQGIIFVCQAHTYALFAGAHAELARKVDLVFEVCLRDQVLEHFYDFARTLCMAAATDTNRNLKHIRSPLFVVYDVDPIEQELALFRLALDGLARRNDRYPLLHILLGDIALLAKQLEVGFCGRDLTRQPE